MLSTDRLLHAQRITLGPAAVDADVVRRVGKSISACLAAVSAGLAGWLWFYVSLVGSAPCSSNDADVHVDCGALTPALGVAFTAIGMLGIVALAILCWQLVLWAAPKPRSPPRIATWSWVVAICLTLQVVVVLVIRATRGW